MSQNLDSDLEAFFDANKPKSGPPCGMCKIPEDYRLTVERGRASGKPYSLLAAFLQSKGFDLGYHVVANHLRHHVRR